MSTEEKDAVMKRFKDGEVKILVSTTVVEVGVDVPNATIMIIEAADRFGLAQLHQLRGRIGRGKHQSYCFLIPSTSQKPSKRLLEIEKSEDGFYLAEVDLELRGPGQLYGIRQHGALDLRMASITDTILINRVQQAVKRFLDSNPDLLQYPKMYHKVEQLRRLTRFN
jgi:ATP-dependent DNA helicase RecG